jgi:hypothetical protein
MTRTTTPAAAALPSIDVTVMSVSSYIVMSMDFLAEEIRL